MVLIPRRETNVVSKTNNGGGGQPRSRLKHDQVQILEIAYKNESYPDTAALDRLAKQVKTSLIKVRNWFNNRRAKASREQREENQLKGILHNLQVKHQHQGSDVQLVQPCSESSLTSSLEFRGLDATTTTAYELDHLPMKSDNPLSASVSTLDSITTNSLDVTPCHNDNHCDDNPFTSYQPLNLRNTSTSGDVQVTMDHNQPQHLQYSRMMRAFQLQKQHQQKESNMVDICVKRRKLNESGLHCHENPDLDVIGERAETSISKLISMNISNDDMDRTSLCIDSLTQLLDLATPYTKTGNRFGLMILCRVGEAFMNAFYNFDDSCGDRTKFGRDLCCRIVYAILNTDEYLYPGRMFHMICDSINKLATLFEVHNLIPSSNALIDLLHENWPRKDRPLHRTMRGEIAFGDEYIPCEPQDIAKARLDYLEQNQCYDDALNLARLYVCSNQYMGTIFVRRYLSLLHRCSTKFRDSSRLSAKIDAEHIFDVVAKDLGSNCDPDIPHRVYDLLLSSGIISSNNNHEIN